MINSFKSIITEIKKMKSLSLRHYFKDFWNIIDLASISCLTISVVLFLMPIRYKEIGTVLSITMLLQIFSFLKISKGFN